MILTLLGLALLAILGAIASRSTITEMQISSNERRYTQTFYAAEAGWRLVAKELGERSTAPLADPDTKAVTVAPPRVAELNGIPYQYEVRETSNSFGTGSGKNFRRFGYQVDSTADNRAQIETRMHNIYKVGY